jgi:hypothetical protein
MSSDRLRAIGVATLLNHDAYFADATNDDIARRTGGSWVLPI